MKKIIIYMLLLLLTVLRVNAYGHKIIVFAYKVSDKVFVECTFADGKVCKRSPVTVYEDKTGTKLFDGITDDGGQYSVTIINTEQLRIVVDVGEGHRGEFILEALQESYEGHEEHEQAELNEITQALCISGPDVENIVNDIMDKKLATVNMAVAKMQHYSSTTRVSDIIGGIGYVFGIFGIIMYFKSKKHAP
ncbi:MAG: hypothetical protein L3V56_08215 [Candidatus Magnetoovum sp. WYHC-5]|nr:hypothetical protein [Candidatus Magnetoovum sp. WYHC-5]